MQAEPAALHEVQDDAELSVEPPTKRLRLDDDSSATYLIALPTRVVESDPVSLSANTPRNLRPSPTLTEDCIQEIIRHILDSAWANRTPIADLQSLARVHSSFLNPVREILYKTPDLQLSRDRDHDCAVSCRSQVGRSEHWTLEPVKALATSLEANPHLGLYLRHLGHFGSLSQSLWRLNVSPSLVSRTVLQVLNTCPNLVSLELPLVDLSFQEDLVQAISNMKGLKRLRLGAGCSRSKSGASSFHEGDLRRIAKECPEIEELFLETDCIGFGLGDGYVEAFQFTKLRKLYLCGATSVGDKHLSAFVRQATGLEDLYIMASASLGIDDAADGVHEIPLTTQGIAQVLQLRGASLKRVYINVADRRPSPDLSPNMIPSIESALGHCTELRKLVLIGPCLLNPSSLPFLGSPSTIRQPSFGASAFSVSKPMQHCGLSKLESLTLGLLPFPFSPLLKFIQSLTPSSGPTTASLTNLKFFSVINPQHDSAFAEKSEILKEAMAGKVETNDSSRSFSNEWWDGNAWGETVKRAGGICIQPMRWGRSSIFGQHGDSPSSLWHNAVGAGPGGGAVFGPGMGGPLRMMRMAGVAGPPPPGLWLRCETKEFEHRAALTPTTAKKLMDAGFKITVERDPQRIFADEEYEKVGCTLAANNSWPSAPLTTPIIGLKELPPNDDSPLPHTHIMFAHCYKQQGGWQSVLARWQAGQPTGMLYDLEFLQDERGRRVAAFGYHAGFAGAAVGALALAEQVDSEGEKGRLGEIKPYANEEALVSYVKSQLEKVEKRLGRKPRALVIGALGRCGKGAVEFFLKAGLRDEDIVKWDMAETAKGGPFNEILEVDIFVNCIYLSMKIPSFVSPESIASFGPNRALRVVVDVSCDTTNPHNPIPIYDINTTFDKPTVDVPGIAAGPPLTVVSIDHLPTLLPREASEAFSNDLLPSLLNLPGAMTERSHRIGTAIHPAEVGSGSNRVWKEAEALFWTKLGESLVKA